MMRKIILSLLILITSFVTLGQSGLGLTQYIFNSQLINPAYFYQRSPISVNLVGRYQWANYPSAPLTIGLSGLYNINDHHTVGLVLSNDRLAGFNTFQAAASYAYRLNLGEKVQLSFGIKLGYLNFASSMNTSTLVSPNDPVFVQQKSISSLTIGTGFFLSGERFFVGLGAPNLFNNGVMRRGFSADMTGNAYYFTAGWKIVNTIPFMFYPSLKVSASVGAPIHGQLDLNFLIQNGLWLSAGVSTEVATNISVGYIFSNGFRIVYNYGFSFGKFNKFGSGVHEITLGYTKDLFQNEFSKRRYVAGHGKFKSYRKQSRRYR
jgi:type IX secretion system PorP/SprF family membrane protein